MPGLNSHVKSVLQCLAQSKSYKSIYYIGARELNLWIRKWQPTGEGNGNPRQYSCLENPRARGAWQAMVYRVAESDRTEVT